MTLYLTLSSKARSGFKWVVHDPRPAARSKPWSVHHPCFRSAGFETARGAAIAVAKFLAGRATSSRVERARSLPARAPSLSMDCAPAAAGIRKSRRAHPSSVCRERRLGPRLAEPCNEGRRATAGACSVLGWPNGSVASGKRCDMFGQRLMMARKHGLPEELAVVKRMQPCGSAPFGVSFDSMPSVVYDYDLFHKSCPQWRTVPWEGSLWETFNRRPVCTRCGHPLDVGAAAWAECLQCGQTVPGACASELLSRMRTGDPYRGRNVRYCESSDDELEA